MLNDIAKEINEVNRDKGFLDEPRSAALQAALIMTELAEFLEADRDGTKDGLYFGAKYAGELGKVDAMPENGTFKLEGPRAELIDVLIRTLGTLDELGADIDALIAYKIAYNKSRPYMHGKNC